MEFLNASYGSDFLAVKKVIEEAPDVRQSRVDAAKYALQCGALPLRGSVFAHKLLQDPLHTLDFDEA